MIEVYQLKIVAAVIKPKIERVILIKSTTTFFELHYVIQNLFGLTAGHLFEFFSVRDAAPISDGEDNTRLANRVKLNAEFKYVKKIQYTYDFGDNWEFSITLQKVLAYDKYFLYPCCISHTGGRLIEDCGGPYCYNLLAAWCRNPTSETKAAVLEQFNEELLTEYQDFDPDDIDINEINRIIGKNHNP